MFEKNIMAPLRNQKNVAKPQFKHQLEQKHKAHPANNCYFRLPIKIHNEKNILSRSYQLNYVELSISWRRRNQYPKRWF